MEAEKKSGLLEVRVGVRDPRQDGKVEHDRVEGRVVAVAAVWAGADTFVEIEAWANDKLDRLQRYLTLEHGIAPHDTFGRLFATISADAFAAAFRCGARQVLPVLGAEDVVAIDGKTCRRSSKVGCTPLHRASAFTAGVGLVLGQQATVVKSNEKTAIPDLLATLALEGYTVTLGAMGTPPSIAQAILDRCADYVLLVKDNPPPWPNRSGISSRPFRPFPIRHPIGLILAVLRHFVLNRIRLAPVKRKGSLKVQRLIAATSKSFRAQLLGLL